MPDSKERFSESMRGALVSLIRDPEVTKPFWKTGADELTVHMTDKAKKAAGGWILTLAIGAILVRVVVWLVQSGVLK